MKRLLTFFVQGGSLLAHLGPYIRAEQKHFEISDITPDKGLDQLRLSLKF